MGLISDASTITESSSLYQHFISSLCCYSPNCQCVEKPEIHRNFPDDFARLVNIIRSKSFSSTDLITLFARVDYVSLLILLYLEQLYNAPGDALGIAMDFQEYGVERLGWLARALDRQELRPLAARILEWLLFYQRKLICELTSLPLNESSYSLEIRKIYPNINASVSATRMEMFEIIARDLVDGAAIGAEKVKTMLDHYFPVINKEIEGLLFKDTVKSAYSRMQSDLLGRFIDSIPCEAQIMANLGTGFISHRQSYDISYLHVELARSFFEESLALLPARVCRKQQNHLKQNIAIAKLVPEILRLIHGAEESEAIAFKNFCYWTRNQKHEWGSALRFVLMMLSDVKDPNRVNLIVESLKRIAFRIGHLYPDLAKKCLEFADNAPLNVASSSSTTTSAGFGHFANQRSGVPDAPMVRSISNESSGSSASSVSRVAVDVGVVSPSSTDCPSGFNMAAQSEYLASTF